MSALPKDPGVYVFRDADGRPLYVGKSVCLRTRARAHFTTPGELDRAMPSTSTTSRRDSELGALVLENRLIKALKPPGNKRLKNEPDGYVYLRCRLDIPFPILEVAREPAAGHASRIGPLRGQAAAAELVEQLNSLFGLRHCGRKLPRRDHPVGVRADGPLPVALPAATSTPTSTASGSTRRSGCSRAADGGAALLAHVDAQMRAAPRPQRYERAAWLRRRRARLRDAARAARRRAARRSTRARGSCSRAHPTDDAPRRRVLDRRRARRRLGPAAGGRRRARRAHRRRAARRARGRSSAAGCAPDELDEARIVGVWLAAHEARVLELTPAAGPGRARRSRLSGSFCRVAA